MAKGIARSRAQAISVRRLLIVSLCLGLLLPCLSAAAKAPPPPSRSNEAPAPSASSLYQWGAVTLFHGLPSDHVRAIAQDSKGTMWFGTDNGLVKYDGRRIQRIAADGPAAACVLAVKFDSDGILWIGTDAGAARLVNREIRTIPETHRSAVTAIITPERGRALMTTRQGEIFDCATANDGSLQVHKIKPEDHRLLTIESQAHAPLALTSLALVENTLVVGTRGRGLLAVDKSQISAAAPREPDSIREILTRPRAFFIQAVETDTHGRLWFGAETSAEGSGLYDAGDLLSPEKIGGGTGTVTALGSDQTGNLWVGTDARGAFKYQDGAKADQFTFDNTAGGLLSNHIYSIFIDREGVVWFGTDRGVCRYDPHGIRVEAISAEAESNFSRALFRSSDGTLWCGTNRGLFAKAENQAWREIGDLKGRVVHCLGEDGEGHLLVGTAAGLFVSTGPSSAIVEVGKPRGRQFSHIDNPNGAGDSIRSIARFRGSVYVANFGRGIERLEGSARSLVWPGDESGAPQRQVVSLHAEGERLWIGTAQEGVFIFDGRRATSDPTLDELRGAPVWSIEGSNDDVLWVATERGLYALRSSKLLPVVEGVDARCVVSAIDRGPTRAAWCATVGQGLYKALLDEQSSGGSFLTSRIDSEQGLPSQNAFALATAREPSGEEVIWIGTSRGVARYEPGRAAPILDVTRVMGKRVYDVEEMRTGLRLDYPQNGLAVDVAAASSRTFPEQFQYSFSVLGRNERVLSEKLSRESQLLLERLSPGSYRVIARAYSRDLIASAPVQFDLVVESAPFPWTSTALSVLLAMALLAVWWGYRQNRRLTGTNRQLAETRMQLANETEAERRRIARDLHDQTLADLRRLMMLTDQLPDDRSRNGIIKPSNFREEIESVSTEIRRICEDLSPSALANVGLAAALEWALADAAAHQQGQTRFDYEFVCDARMEDMHGLEPAAQIQVYRIVQEAVSNSGRHSSATRVRLAVAVGVEGDLLIELEDNGCGFDANRPGHTGRGLANIRSRASLIQARAEWSPRPEGGTVFKLRVPRAASTHHPG